MVSVSGNMDDDDLEFDFVKQCGVVLKSSVDVVEVVNTGKLSDRLECLDLNNNDRGDTDRDVEDLESIRAPTTVAKTSSRLTTRKRPHSHSPRGILVQQQPGVRYHDDVARETLQVWCIVMEADGDGDNLLHTAIICNMTHLALLLIDLLVDHKQVSVPNKLLQTPLHLAALTDNNVVARRLVVAGAKVELQDHNGNTPLHIACIRGSKLMAQALLSPVRYHETQANSFHIPYQAIPQNLNIRNFQGQTCVIIAAVYRRRELLELLFENAADVNSIDMKTGKTALHIAAESGDIPLIECITSKSKVRLNCATYSGYTPADLAYFHGHTFAVYKLRVKGAAEPRGIVDPESESE